MTRHLSTIALIVSLCFVSGSILAASSTPRTVIGWDFSKPGDMMGWVPNGDLTGITVTSAGLQSKATGSDPTLESPKFDIPATPHQWVEIRLKSDMSGSGQLYWSNTLDSPYGGFLPEKVTYVDVPGDNQWHTLRVYPFWHTEKRLIHLRFDMFQGSTFTLGSIRVVEPASTAPAIDRSSWDFGSAPKDWKPVYGISVPTRAGDSIMVRVKEKGGLLCSPALKTPVGDRMWLSVRMRTAKGSRAAIAWANDIAPGLHEMRFPIRSDGRFHTYNVDMGNADSWGGNLLYLGLRPSYEANDAAEIRSISLEKDITGAPDLGILNFGMTDAVNRTGQACRVEARFLNYGADPAKGITARISVPAGVKVRPLQQRSPVFEFGVPGSFRYALTSTKPVDGEMTIRLSGNGAPVETFKARVHITPALDLPKTSQIPPVKPAKTDYQVGLYYFPGWDVAARWECIDRVMPYRKPVLGYYDEANPEIADWQIKWAVEHGITFFMVDWYWCQGSRMLEHWLNNAYMKSRNRKYLNWCVMWANHNAPGSNSEADWRNVTQYWIDNYFGMKEYLRINGKPAVFIWSPENIRNDMGGTDGAKRLLDMSQEMAKAAGYQGITFVAMNSDNSAEHAKTLAHEGYVMNTEYHWWADAHTVSADPMYFPYASVVDRSPKTWAVRDKVMADAGITFLPVAETGWDPRPWHGDKSYIMHDRTPAQFERLLRSQKAYADAHRQKLIVLGPCNEWGEGSYIEPSTDYGFEMYDAVRRVYCKEPEAHVDAAPVDVGMGPYDLEGVVPPAKSAWDFGKSGSADGWYSLMGMTNPEVKDGCLYSKTGNTDPALGSPSVSIPAAGNEYMIIRMKTDPVPGGKLCMEVFWSTITQSISAANCMLAEVIADGEFHTYSVHLGESPRWRGNIRGLRIDPGAVPGVGVWIDEIHFASKPDESK